MKRTPSRSSFRPELERLEERETPAAASSALSASTIGPLLVQQQVTAEVSQMNSLNSMLKTDQATLTTDIMNGASAQTIAGDYGRAASAFGQIKALNGSVQTTVMNGELTALLTLLSGKSSKTSAGVTVTNQQEAEAAAEAFEDGTTPPTSAKSSKSSSSSLLTLFTLFSLQQQGSMASSILSQATATANTAEPDGFPTIASVS
jgi:hypothetical protein